MYKYIHIHILLKLYLFLGVNVIRYGLSMNDAASGGPCLSEIPDINDSNCEEKNEEKIDEVETLYGASTTLFSNDEIEGK
jgi:hypothetical protein